MGIIGANGADATDERLLVVSVDGHVGAPLDHYRPYCPEVHLDDFDDFIRALHAGGVGGVPKAVGDGPSRYTPGAWKLHQDMIADELIHYEPRASLATMDEDGVALEVIYHGAINGNPMPFLSMAVFGSGEPYAEGAQYRELAAVGVRMYNRWLADYCSIAPERFLGLAHLPLWDPQLAVAEVEFAREAGLRGINLPAPRRGIADFDNPVWEPLWSAAESLGMSLHTHGGSNMAVNGVANYDGAEAVYTLTYDLIHFSRRAIPFMIFGGVFERHPGLRLVLTEQPSQWVESTLSDLDGLWAWPRYAPAIPRKPSEYFREHCFIGGSFMSNAEAKSAVAQGIVGNLLWGRDFPHPEGTWPHTRLSYRSTMAELPPDAIRRILGGNAVDALGLDPKDLWPIADSIGPTLREVATPITDDLPQETKWSMAFRGATAWA